MIKGLMITPPVIGRISIGKVVERNGKRLPEKDDEFTITTQVQQRSGWVLHPLDGILRRELADGAAGGSVGGAVGIAGDIGNPLNAPSQPTEMGSNAVYTAAPTKQASLKSKLDRRAQAGLAATDPAQNETQADADMHRTAPAGLRQEPRQPKLRSIPVRLLFNDPDLNLRANYTLFDRATARPICVGDGQSCKRVTPIGVQSLSCEGPDICALGTEGGCKPFGRFNVRIEHPENHSDVFSTFVLRTTGINTLRTLLARMQYLNAISGGLLAYLPLELRLRGKSTAQSHRTPIYYVDLCVRHGISLLEAIAHAQATMLDLQQAGLDQARLEDAAREGYALGLFEELAEDAGEVVQEFYPEAASVE